ncbi:CHRNA7-FAM7A fusion protein [Nymphon striatum]|nr:CHRNA7-FAM7A fusion protein [Nymphon striatum]
MHTQTHKGKTPQISLYTGRPRYNYLFQSNRRHIRPQNVWLELKCFFIDSADSQYNDAMITTNVIVTSNGNVTYLISAIFKSSCKINVAYFPFDEQRCKMKFASWTYDGKQLNLLTQTSKGDISNYVSNGEWDLIDMVAERNVVHYSCCPDDPYMDITLHIILRRRPLFYVFNLILPCILITVIALMSFYMPSDSGEKVTLGITTLLSMTVFLMVVGESMPPTSETLPLIALKESIFHILLKYFEYITVCDLFSLFTLSCFDKTLYINFPGSGALHILHLYFFRIKTSSNVV